MYCSVRVSFKKKMSVRVLTDAFWCLIFGYRLIEWRSVNSYLP